MTHEHLTQVWDGFCKMRSLPRLSADELFAQDYLSESERAFVGMFIKLWETAEDAELLDFLVETARDLKIVEEGEAQ